MKSAAQSSTPALQERRRRSGTLKSNWRAYRRNWKAIAQCWSRQAPTWRAPRRNCSNANRRLQEQRRAAILHAVSAASSVRNRITQAEERIAALDREAQRLHGESEAGNYQL